MVEFRETSLILSNLDAGICKFARMCSFLCTNYLRGARKEMPTAANGVRISSWVQNKLVRMWQRKDAWRGRHEFENKFLFNVFSLKTVDIMHVATTVCLYFYLKVLGKLNDHNLSTRTICYFFGIIAIILLLTFVPYLIKL